MKKLLIILLVAALAVTSVFAYSDVTAKIGYDIMSFNAGKQDGENCADKFNGLSFGLRGDVDVIKGFCVTASVDGIVPFFMEQGNSSAKWQSRSLWKSNYSEFGVKTKLGASYKLDMERVDFSLGLNGIFGTMFVKSKSDTDSGITLMNLGLGADLCIDFHVTPHHKIGFELAPELMFPKTWTVEKVSGTKFYHQTSDGTAQFACSAQVTATIIF